jgi:asparagine synthase (glutamine-hydrolysing)
MCGVVGMWSHGRPDVSAARFQSVVGSLAHRGPDGEGLFHDPDLRLHLGHRRLAILDPSPAGSQPMASDDGDYVIVFNGEIYNFLEVRAELALRGHRFRTSTDTEVLIAAFREWGEDMLGRLNGMWAFAIWDRRERRLFLARDRFGVKPLLYHHSASMFAFASELKAFAAMPGVPLDLDAATLAFSPMEMETVGPTLLQGVRALRPGHVLTVTADGELTERAWWRTVDHLPGTPQRYGEQVEAFREHLAEACRLRMRADVPLGTSLSGGLDSSSVAAMVHHVGGQAGFTADWQRIFSQGNPGTSQDESRWAAQVAEHLGAPVTWTDASIERELEHLEASILAFEGVHILPLGLWSHYRTLREHGVVISIDGHGGDELLGGYPRFATAMRRRAFRTVRLGTWRRYATAGAPTSGRGGQAALLRSDLRAVVDLPTHRANLSDRPTTLALRLSLRRLAPLRSAPGGVRAADDELADRATQRLERLRSMERETRDLTPLSAMLYSAFHHGILPSILRNFDRLSMASGVEIRSPLLDWRLVTFALALPDDARIGGGWTKRILRDATQGLLPDDVRFRRDKKGFSSPMQDWLGRGLGDRAAEVVSDPAFLSRSAWDGALVRARVNRARAEGDVAALKRDWPFVQTELLLRGFDGIARAAEKAA